MQKLRRNFVDTFIFVVSSTPLKSPCAKWSPGRSAAPHTLVPAIHLLSFMFSFEVTCEVSRPIGDLQSDIFGQPIFVIIGSRETILRETTRFHQFLLTVVQLAVPPPPVNGESQELLTLGALLTRLLSTISNVLS